MYYNVRERKAAIMLTVFLCDDNRLIIEKYCALITQIAKNNQIEITLSTFESGESLVFHLSDSPNQADIIYLDILMGVQNGIDAARQLRNCGCKAEIVFLTTSEDFVYEAFDVTPVQYLVKDSTSASKFEQVFLRAVSLVKDKTTEMFLCESGTSRELLPLKSVT